MDAVTRIARAVLYEGYILWPYRRSALKNQQRWTFGGVYPEAYGRARGGNDPWTMQTQCLLEAGPDPRVEVRLRFLHVVERRVARVVGRSLEPVDELVVGGERYLSWDEATEREVVVPALDPATLGAPRRESIEVRAGRATEWLTDPAGTRAGAIVRSWRLLRGVLEVRTELLETGLYRLTVRLTNTTPWRGGSRDDALRQTFVSTHMVLRAADGDFVSLTDPPEAYRDAAAACENSGTWPVLVGEPGERQTLLSSPIILPDYPEVAPESPGDLFDGAEIDQLLILSILGMTDAEKEEMRATDPKAREILDRCAALSPEQLMRLYGAIREFRPIGGDQAT